MNLFYFLFLLMGKRWGQGVAKLEEEEERAAEGESGTPFPGLHVRGGFITLAIRAVGPLAGMPALLLGECMALWLSPCPSGPHPR